MDIVNVFDPHFRSLQPRDAPDVVRSTYAGEFRVDNLLGVPEKINIPERYVPEEQVRPDAQGLEVPSIDATSEHCQGCMRGNIWFTQADERSPEERRTRLKKADSIRRMLAESQANQPIPSKSPNRIWNCKHIENWMKFKKAWKILPKLIFRTRG